MKFNTTRTKLSNHNINRHPTTEKNHLKDQNHRIKQQSHMNQHNDVNVIHFMFRIQPNKHYLGYRKIHSARKPPIKKV